MMTFHQSGCILSWLFFMVYDCHE